MKPQHDLQIQKCAPAEYKIVADIYNQYIQQNGYTMDNELKTAAHIQKWADKFNEREALYVAKAGQAIVGWGIIKRYSDREGYRPTCETSVFLDSAHLRKGYGTRIKKFLLERCKALNYHHLVAKIWSDNTASIAYNQKLGYEIVGTQREVGFKNGKWVDVVIMQYIMP